MVVQEPNPELSVAPGAPRQSAGILLYKHSSKGVRVLLGHMGGPLWNGKNAGAWTVPKRKLDEGETPFAAALREFEEEIGFRPTGDFIALSTITQRSGKLVHTWAVEGDFDPALIKSNITRMEWPPHSGSTVTFPELDRADWFTLEEAGRLAVKGQAGIFEELEQLLTGRGLSGQVQGIG